MRSVSAGFSLGGYTMIAIAGGITSRAHFRESCASPDTDQGCGAPEFPDPPSKAKALADSDTAFGALAQDSGSYRDQRVRAVFVMATGLDQAFLPESLKQIDIPVAIVAGAREREQRDTWRR
jgi:predicted dienelactone hydrolase